MTSPVAVTEARSFAVALLLVAAIVNSLFLAE